MHKFSFVLVAALGISSLGHAQTKVPWEKDQIKIVDIYNVAKLPAKSSAATKLKWDEIHANWKECRKESASMLNQNLIYRGWILVTHLKCTRKEIETTKKKTTLVSALDQSFKVRNVLLDGAWTSSYAQEYNRLFVSAQKVGKLTTVEANKFFRLKDDLTDDNLKTLLSQVYPLTKKTKKEIQLTDQPPITPKPLTSLFSTFADVARLTHRRIAFDESLIAATGALKFHPQDVQMLWIAGRSALFLGRYEEAKKYFTTLTELGSDSSEADEAAFRLGLLHYRLGNYQLAIAPFESVIKKGSDRYELNSWYWLYRSLEAMKSDKAELIRAQIVARYPYSYYGLKLIGSLKNLPSEKVTIENKNVDLYGSFADSYNRVKTLLKNGWLIEAQLETNTWPIIPEPGWAVWLANHRLWPAAIRTANRVTDDELVPRSWEFMAQFYPTDYSNDIKSVASTYFLDPVVIQSLIRQESAYGLKAFSTSAAMGLMQMIPATAADLARKLKLKIDLEEEIYLPPNNIPMGTSYISSIVDDFGGHIPLALASYNAGPHKIKSWLSLRPETANLKDVKTTEPRDELWMDELPYYETSFYVKAILRNIILYRLKLDPTYEVQPNFWQEMWQKKSGT